jgi:hypothetical protein
VGAVVPEEEEEEEEEERKKEEEIPGLLHLPANLVLYFKSFCKMVTNLF